MHNRKYGWILIGLTVLLTSSCTVAPAAEMLFRTQISKLEPGALRLHLYYPHPFSMENATKYNTTLCGTFTLGLSYSIAVTLLRDALVKRIESADRERVHEIMTWAEGVQSSDRYVAKAMNCLWSEAAYAIDVMDGTRYLARDEVASWQVRTTEGKALINPIDFTVNDQSFYLLDGGTIYRGLTPSSISSETVLTATAVLTSQTRIDGYWVQEIVAIAVREDDGSIVALDKSNDIYQYDVKFRAWHLLSLDRPYVDAYAPQYIDIEFGDDGLHVLDVAGNRVWLQAWPEQQQSPMARKTHWEDQSLKEGIRLTNRNDTVFVLLRNGQIRTRDSNTTKLSVIPAARANSHVVGIEREQIVPVALALGEDGDTIFVADRGTRRIIALDRNSGSVIGQIMAPDWTNFDHLQGVQAQDGWLYLMVEGVLFRLAEPRWSSIETRALWGVLPRWSTTNDVTLDRYGGTKPNDLRLAASLRSLSFVMPIAGAKLPSRMSLYPGARRAYRYGVHHGLDFFSEDSGVPIMIGTPVRAVANGIVKRADIEYYEMNADELAELLEETRKQHRTPVSTLNKLRGRQIWIDHGNGVWTIYSHLDRIPPGIWAEKQVKTGDVIGFVGASGTPDGVYGATSGAHLHFEIWIGDWPKYYVGQWLTINETWRIFEAIFAESNVLTASHDVYSAELVIGPTWDTFTPLHSDLETVPNQGQPINKAKAVDVKTYPRQQKRLQFEP